MKPTINPCILLIWRLSIVWCVFAPSLAIGYVPPVEGLLRGWIEQRRGQNNKDMTLYMSSELMPLASESTGSGELVEERWYLQKSERSRLVRLVEPEWVEIYKMGQGWQGKTGSSGQRHRQVEPFVLLWWADGDDVAEIKQRIGSELKRMGLDMEVSSLGRMGEELFYIIGAKSYELHKPQLWLNKSTLLPSRFVLPATTTTTTAAGQDSNRSLAAVPQREIRWLEHGQGAALAGFPRLMEYWEQGVCVRKMELRKIEQQRLPSTLFELPLAP